MGLENEKLIVAAVASGLPDDVITDAAGADAYASIGTSPAARQAHYMHVAVGNNGATISLDGGTTDHFTVPANVERLFPGLKIPAGTDVQAKNKSAGNNYSDLVISIW